VVELADVLVVEGSKLQLHQHMAFEDAVVEDEIDEAVRVSDQDALLAGLETKAVTHLQQKALQAVEQLVFEDRFGHHLGALQAQELEDVRIADDVPRQ